MIARFADGRVVVQDFRETAPAAATANMYVLAAEKKPDQPSPSEFGHLAVAVPGVVAGRCQALAQYGTLPLKRVLGPAIQLAKSGYPVDDDYVRNARTVLDMYEARPSLKQSGTYVYRVHLGNGRLREPGQSLVQPDLAQLLEEIASNGPDFFYKGPVAQSIAREMREHGGIITERDLADYQTRLREPLVTTYRDFKLILMPSPSSGGVALAETLNILEAVDFRSAAQRDPIAATHLQLEAMKHAFADRARWMGDQDFVRAPIASLMSKAYAATLAKKLNPDHVSLIEGYGSLMLPDDAGTSHFCVADKFGNVVVSTETINTEFGSLAAVDEWGLILNNEMDDFTAETGKPNAFGLVQSAQNAIEPRKRPLSSMSPSIVLKNDQPYLLLGASGGPRIISSVLNVLLGVTDLGLSLEDAIQRPRPHHQWSPDLVFFDSIPPPADVSAGLTSRGHKLADKKRTAIVQAILRSPDGWIGASDPRKGGVPAGY
ncbi:MAG: gamma-glutamyltransferase, partial [Candidatus Binataceae bacterium]